MPLLRKRGSKNPKVLNDSTASTSNSNARTTRTTSSRVLRSTEKNKENGPSHQTKRSSVFGDIDLSDIKFNDTFESFKNTSVLHPVVVPEPSNAKRSLQDEFDLSDLELDSDPAIKHSSTVKKTFEKKQVASSRSKNTETSTKRRALFGDIDLSDLQVDQTFESFRSTRACKPVDIPAVVVRTPESKSKNIFDDIDLSDIVMNESFKPSCSRDFESPTSAKKSTVQPQTTARQLSFPSTSRAGSSKPAMPCKLSPIKRENVCNLNKTIELDMDKYFLDTNDEDDELYDNVAVSKHESSKIIQKPDDNIEDLLDDDDDFMEEVANSMMVTNRPESQKTPDAQRLFEVPDSPDHIPETQFNDLIEDIDFDEDITFDDEKNTSAISRTAELDQDATRPARRVLETSDLFGDDDDDELLVLTSQSMMPTTTCPPQSPQDPTSDFQLASGQFVHITNEQRERIAAELFEPIEVVTDRNLAAYVWTQQNDAEFSDFSIVL